MRLNARPAQAGDLTALKAMIDEYLATDYYSREELEECIRGERNLFYVVTDADRGDALAAFYYAFLAPLDEALKTLHVRERPEALRQYPGDTLVGVYKTASTATEYRKQGICTSFVRGLEPEMRRRGARMIVGTAWRTPDGKVFMKGIFHDTGFKPVAVIRRPWQSMTLHCAYCKQTHCICDAVFYVKMLDDTEGGNTHE